MAFVNCEKTFPQKRLALSSYLANVTVAPVLVVARIRSKLGVESSNARDVVSRLLQLPRQPSTNHLHHWFSGSMQQWYFQMQRAAYQANSLNVT
jgi:hypothetical protein